MKLQRRAENLGTSPNVVALSAYVSVLVKRIRFSVESRLRLFGCVSSEREGEIRRIVEGAHGLHIVTALSRQNP